MHERLALTAQAEPVPYESIPTASVPIGEQSQAKGDILEGSFVVEDSVNTDAPAFNVVTEDELPAPTEYSMPSGYAGERETLMADIPEPIEYPYRNPQAIGRVIDVFGRTTETQRSVDDVELNKRQMTLALMLARIASMRTLRFNHETQSVEEVHSKTNA